MLPKNKIKRILTRILHKASGVPLFHSNKQSDISSNYQDIDQIELVFAALSRYTHEHGNLPLRAEVISQCHRALLDCIAAIRAGIGTIEGRIVLGNLNAFRSVKGKRFGQDAAPERIRQASFALSCLSQIYDYNDGNPTTGTQGSSLHPGRVIIPCALSASQFLRTNGALLLRWMILGYDIALGTQHPPLKGSCDAIGAAAIYSLAYGLDQSQTAMAMKIACFLAPRSGGDDFELNHLTCAQQAAAAHDAVHLVKCNHPTRPVPSRYAGRFEFNNPEYPGEQMLGLYFKPYPCCRYIHPLIDLAIVIHSEAHVRPSDIREITLTIPKRLQGPDSILNPSFTGKSLQFNFPFCVAAAILTGGLQTIHFDPSYEHYNIILEVARHTHCSYSISDEATIAIELRNGSQIAKNSYGLSSLGSYDKPIPITQHEEKLSNHVSDAQTANRILRLISQIEIQDNVDELFELVVQRPT